MQAAKTGILLVNLGSPDSPSVKDVRRYLGEFLMDENVIDVPWLLRSFIVKGTILPFRPKESAHAYKQIWWDDGSPLIVISRRVEKLLQERVEAPVELAMRYGNPSIEHGIQQLKQRLPDMEEMFIIPLYPHYAMSTVKSVVEKTEQVMAKHFWNFKLNFLPPFYQEENYISALAESIQPYLQQDFDYYLFSYHGIPERHVKKTDPTGCHCLQVENCCEVASDAHNYCYRHQCFETTKAVTNKLGMASDKFSNSFQSRLGRDPWLRPYTDFEYVRLAEQGVKRMAVLCPAFVSDCLETLEEIGMRGKEDFIAAGGEDLVLIPCLNDHPAWIETLTHYCEQYTDTKVEPIT